MTRGRPRNTINYPDLAVGGCLGRINHPKNGDPPPFFPQRLQTILEMLACQLWK